MKETAPIASQVNIAFLRGINVGGNHKVPMEKLRAQLGKMGFYDINTILNSGNIIFKSEKILIEDLEKDIEKNLEENFKFPIPVVIRKADEILNIIKDNPFKNFKENKDMRLYISFLKGLPDQEIRIPLTSEDKSFQIFEVRDKNVFSVLDISKTSTVKGMAILGHNFGNNITTRNWNTLVRIGEKLEGNKI